MDLRSLADYPLVRTNLPNGFDLKHRTHCHVLRDMDMPQTAAPYPEYRRLVAQCGFFLIATKVGYAVVDFVLDSSSAISGMVAGAAAQGLRALTSKVVYRYNVS
jgi:hypothetical protein